MEPGEERDAALRVFVLSTLAAGGPTHVRLFDACPLHRAFVDAADRGELPATVGGLGHRPDVFSGVRVPRLDAVVAGLAADGILVPDGGAVRLTAAGRRLARSVLRSACAADAASAQQVAGRWQALTAAQRTRRSLAADGAA